jgi:pilus assembly protein CpaC
MYYQLWILCVSCLGLIPLSLHAADRFVTLNDAANISVNQPINKVFVSDADTADYQVIDDNKIVIFGKEIGQTRLIVYGDSGQVLFNDRIIVDIDLSQVRRQLKLHYPALEIKIESVGEQVAVSGMVYSEQERDDIYRMVASLLKREKIERFDKAEKLEFVDSGLKEPEAFIFARNFMWEGIIEKLVINSVQQVNVKISIAQVTESFGETLGTDWGSIGASVGSFSFTQFEAADLSTIITALGDESMAEVLAEPNLTVLSGESASFLVGGEVPVIVTTDGSVNITFKEFGIKLDLTAKIMDSDKIRMQIAPEVSEVEKYIKAVGIEVPQFSSRRAMTTVELADGESFMLGGLMSSADFEQIQKIPLLGDIPVIGAAFRKSVTERKKTELLIVATVNLVKPVSPKDVQLPYMVKSSTLMRLFRLKGPKNNNDIDDLTIELLSRGGFIQ